MNPNSLQKIERFWTHDLGLDAEVLPAVQGIVCTVQHLYPGIQLFRRGTTVIIASPPGKADFIRNAVHGCSPDEVFSVRWLESVLDGQFEVILGPAELNYADAKIFRFARHECARPLSAPDSDAYHALVRALDDVEVTEGGVSADKFPAFGAFLDNTLCAVASYKVWGVSIAHITVATHPEYRRRGFAKAAVQALAAEAIDLGLILQWQSLTSNKRSLALAADLGFEHYASKIFVRLKT